MSLVKGCEDSYLLLYITISYDFTRILRALSLHINFSMSLVKGCEDSLYTSLVITQQRGKYKGCPHKHFIQFRAGSKGSPRDPWEGINEIILSRGQLVLKCQIMYSAKYSRTKYRLMGLFSNFSAILGLFLTLSSVPAQ